MRALLACALGAALALPARPDTLFLQDGRIYEDVALERSGDSVTVWFENGQVVLPLSAVLDAFDQDGPGLVPATEEAEQKIAEGLVFFQDQWVRPKVRARKVEKILAARRAEAEEIKASRLWRNRRTEETKHFEVEYTVAPAIFDDFRDLMEAYYGLFSKRWKIRTPRGFGKLKVHFYVDPENFYQVTGASRGTLAFFRFVEAPYELHFYYDRLDPRGTERDLLHELGHYLHKLVDVDFRFSHWPGASLAEYFSTVRWDERRKKVDVDPRVLEDRLISIRKDIEDGERVSLVDLVEGCNERAFRDYTWGWSLVYFLMSREDTRKDFEKFFLALARGKDVQREGRSIGHKIRYARVEGDEMLRLFRKHMGLRKDSDLAELETAWHRFVENELDVVTSRGLARAAAQARRHGRKLRARRLYEEAIAAGGAIGLTHHRYAVVLGELKKPAEAWEQWAAAVELDPLVPEYYIAWGESLIEAVVAKEGDPEPSEAATTARKEEGKRLLRLAQEIEPDNLYLETHLERLLQQ